MAKQKKNHGSIKEEFFWGPEIEYVMTRAQYEALTSECKGDKMKFAIDYINQTYGLLGHVTTLHLEDKPIYITPILELE